MDRINDSVETINLEKQYSSGVYSKRDLMIVRGRGALLFDSEGHEYIDLVGGQGIAILGHSHPDIIQTIQDQSINLITCPEMFCNPIRARYQEKLIEVAPNGMERVFLCNSGTEAIEAAIKFSRLTTGRKEIISAMRGFHGRTMGALSATWKKQFRQPFEPLLTGFKHVLYNQLDDLEKAISKETAAVILEVVQGEGGVYPGTAKYLQGAQALCRENGALFIIDEVQTGFGRTGKLFALEHFNLEPDLLCLAKAISGGLPGGAVLIGKNVKPFPPGAHGSTFGGNPLSCAAGLATLDIIGKESLIDHSAVQGAYLLSRLNEIDSNLIREIRGLGLMVGIEIKQKVAPFIQQLQDKGVLVLSAGMTTIRLLPPLVITREQIDQAVTAIDEVLNNA